MRNNKGFSLVELIVVIAIMAILAAVAIPTFAGFIKKANVAADEGFANDIEYAVELALAAEDADLTAVAVTYDKSDKAIVKLTYTAGGTTYDVIGSGNTPADADVVEMITGTIDAKYALKTDGPVKSESEVVTITVQD